MELRQIFAAMAIASSLGAAAVETVTVTEAGQLAGAITEELKYTVAELKVSGPINGEDIGFLREMAGVALDDYDTPTEGVLVSLDLSDATIVAGGKYLTKKYEVGTAKDNTIGENMWRNAKLTQIVLPTTTTTIGATAFLGSALTSMSVPEGVTSIGGMCFTNCSALASIDLAPSVTSIGSNCFENCKELTYVKLSEITTLQDNTFSGCDKLTEIDLPATVTTMGYSTPLPSVLEILRIQATTPPAATAESRWGGSFRNIDKDKCVVYVPAGKIDAYKKAEGWNEFKNFQEIVEHEIRTEIDATLTVAGTLGEYVTEDDIATVKKLKISGPVNGTDLRLIRAMAGKDERWNDTDGVLTDIDMTDAVMVEGGDNICVPLGMETTPNPVWIVARADALPEELFSHTIIETVKLPLSLKMIYSSFSDATHLGGHIVVPEGVEVLGEWAFSNTRITGITLPSTLHNIEGSPYGFNNLAICAHAFQNCESLTSIELPAGVTIIKDSTFEGCASLTEFHLPVTVEKLCNRAFAGSGIRDFYVETVEPVKAEYKTFDGFDVETCILHVPAHSAANYRAAAEWCDFVNIVEGEATAAELILTTTADDFSGVTVTVDEKAVELTGTSVSLEAEVGSVVVISPADFAVISSVTAEGAAVESLEDGSFRVVITSEEASVGIDWITATVKVATLPSYSDGVVTGHLLLSYDGVTAESISLPLGATLTFVAEAEEGYKFDHVTRVTDGSDDSISAGDSYTAVRADMDEEVLFKAVFTKIESGISSVVADLGADTAVSVMTPAGVCVMTATASTLDLGGLPAGIYIVTGGGKTVKVVR